MPAIRSSERSVASPAKTLALTLVATALTGFGPAAQGEADTPLSSSTSVPLAKLERAFWLCDHAATTRGVDGDAAILCVAATEELKERKFGGDFEQLLTWWRQNKATEHANLDRREESLANR